MVEPNASMPILTIMSLHGLHGSPGPSKHYMVCNFIAYIKIDNGPKGDLRHLSGSFTNGFFG